MGCGSGCRFASVKVVDYWWVCLWDRDVLDEGKREENTKKKRGEREKIIFKKRMAYKYKIIDVEYIFKCYIKKINKLISFCVLK